MNKFIGKKRFNLIYPSLLLVGVLFNLFLDGDTLQRQKDTHYLLSSGNIINKVFAYHGNDLWLVLFVALSALQIHHRRIQWDPLPRDARAEPRPKLTSLIREYVVKLLLKMVLLYVIFYVIDHVFVWTGGSCSVSTTKSAELCRKEGGKWEGGFDISGHFCFLTNISLILWMELYSFQQFVSNNEVPLARKWIIVIYVNVFVLITWAFVLSVTAIYYHTFPEKLLGLAMGYICPLVMYIVIPSFPVLTKWIY